MLRRKNSSQTQPLPQTSNVNNIDIQQEIIGQPIHFTDVPYPNCQHYVSTISKRQVHLIAVSINKFIKSYKTSHPRGYDPPLYNLAKALKEASSIYKNENYESSKKSYKYQYSNQELYTPNDEDLSMDTEEDDWKWKKWKTKLGKNC